MFYAHFVLSKKGPLARIWLAAHWDKKLTKAHVFETNIDSSVEAIIQPKVKLALRTSGHLLLGVVRIYSRKAKYLLADCNEAFVKIKMAFRPGVVDLAEENREAAVNAITLPETFHDFDTTMADLSDIAVLQQFSVNQSRPEEITMREDQIGNITLVGDDGFGDMGFDGGNIIQDAHMDDTLYVKNPDASDLLLDDPVHKGRSSEKGMSMDFDSAARGDGFGSGMGDFVFAEEPAGVEDDDESDDGGDFGGGVDHELFGENFVGEAGGLFEEPPVPEITMQPDAEANQQQKEAAAAKGSSQEDAGPVIPEPSTTVRDQTTLITDDAQAFALEPIDVTHLGTERKAKRKRKLIIDEMKGIASETMKLQLSDTSDIITTLDLAPPTKKLMHWKETGGVEKLFALPGRSLTSKKLARLFKRNLVTKSFLVDQEEALDLEKERALYEQQHHHQLQLQNAHDEPEIARDAEQSRIEPSEQPSMVEPASLLEEPSRIEPPSFAESSIMSKTAEDSVAPPPADTTIEPVAPLMQRQDSSDDDADNFFDMPDDVEQSSPSAHEEESDGVEGEEAEEQRWTKRTQQMMHVLERVYSHGENEASFKTIVSRNNRKQVASKFYTLLVLKKLQGVTLAQATPFGDILITKGPKYGVVS
ncbi:hypothetical protein LSAT2_001248 [Lamellibrachia satsuma]|nr:hypothetical protein LSAT2_001248 [Lamellibrachia satsuma]